MVEAFKTNSQFIFLLIVMYVIGVWLDPIIYLLFPVIYGLYGLKGQYLEVLIMSIWMLILSDYIPVKGATYADLQFAKDLKPIIPLFLFGFYIRSRTKFPPISKLFIRFIPFLIVILIAMIYSINIHIHLHHKLASYSCI